MNMIEVKTAELIGPALDWAVANAAGLPLCEEACQGDYILVGAGDGDLERYSPSTDWSQCGPLIDKHNVSLHCPQHAADCWAAWIKRFACESAQGGPTALVASCRTIVATILGDVVSVPAELVNGGGL